MYTIYTSEEWIVAATPVEGDNSWHLRLGYYYLGSCWDCSLYLSFLLLLTRSFFCQPSSSSTMYWVVYEDACGLLLMHHFWLHSGSHLNWQELRMNVSNSLPAKKEANHLLTSHGANSAESWFPSAKQPGLKLCPEEHSHFLSENLKVLHTCDTAHNGQDAFTYWSRGKYHSVPVACTFSVHDDWKWSVPPIQTAE